MQLRWKHKSCNAEVLKQIPRPFEFGFKKHKKSLFSKCLILNRWMHRSIDDEFTELKQSLLYFQTKIHCDLNFNLHRDLARTTQLFFTIKSRQSLLFQLEIELLSSHHPSIRWTWTESETKEDMTWMLNVNFLDNFKSSITLSLESSR